MPRFATLFVLLFLAPLALRAQSVTVETLVPAGSEIDDGLALGPDGGLYGSRFGGFPTPVGRTVTRVDTQTGATTVYASGFARANGLAFADDGRLFVANYNTGQVQRVSASGGKGLPYAQANSTVSGLAIDPQSGLLYVASYDGDWIKTVSASGAFTDVITNGLEGPAGLAFDDQNRLHVANFDDGKIYRIEGNGLVLLADLNTSVGFLAYGGGRFFATGINSDRIYAVTASGEVSVLAGTGQRGTVDGSGSAAQFSKPNGIVATAAGDTLYVSDSGNRAVRRIVIQTPTAAEQAPEATGLRLHIAPNPASGEATIRYRLNAASEVEIALFDVLGRKLRVLETGERSEGEHTTGFNSRTLASGVYIVSVTHGGGTESQRLIRR